MHSTVACEQAYCQQSRRINQFFSTGRLVYAMMSVTQPDDVITVSVVTSISAAVAAESTVAADDDDGDGVACDVGDDAVKSANIVTTDARCDSSDEKSMTSSCGLMTLRSRDCRMRLIGSTLRNCTNARLRARSAAAIFAFCFVKPTPSNVCQRRSENPRDLVQRVKQIDS